MLLNRLATITVAASLLLTLYGVFAQQLLQQDLWNANAEYQVLAVFMVCFSLAATGLYKDSWARALSGVAVALYAFYLLGALPVLSVCFALLACVAIGDWIYQGLAGSVQGGVRDEFCLKASLGAAAFVAVIQVASHFPVNTPVYYFALCSVLIASRWRQLIDLLTINDGAEAGLSSKQQVMSCGAMSLLLFAIALNVIVACKPEIGHDALVMHLRVPSYISTFQMWHFDHSKAIWALAPLGADYIYTLAYLFGGEYAARLINLAIFLLTASLLYQMIRHRLGVALTRLLLAAYLSAPLFGLVTGSLYVDNFWSLMTFSAFYVVAKGQLSFVRRWYVAVFFLSVAMATKVMSVFIIPVFVIYFFWQAREDSIGLPAVIKTIVGSALLLALIGGKTYWFALYETGNPVFPFMNDIFKSEYYGTKTAFNNPLYTQGFSSLTLLYDLTMDSSRFLESFDGAFGFLWLMFLPASLLYLARGMTSSVLFSVLMVMAIVAGVFSKQAYIRYIIPVMPLALYFMCHMFSRGFQYPPFRNLSVLSLVLVVALNISLFTSSSHYQRGLFDYDFDGYIKQHVPVRILVDHLNETDPGRNVLFMGRAPYFAAELKAEAYAENWYFPLINAKLIGGDSAIGLSQIIKDYDLQYVVFLKDELEARLGLVDAVKQNFTVVKTVGGAVLARLNEDVIFSPKDELLANRDFGSDFTNWYVGGEPMANTTGVKISNVDVLVQALAVSGGEYYRLTYTLNCSEPAVMRLQMNWHDTYQEFLSAFIETKECYGQEQVFTAIVQAPPEAAVSFFYVAMHEPSPAEVISVSFQKVENVK